MYTLYRCSKETWSGCVNIHLWLFCFPPTFICPAVSEASYRLDAQTRPKPPEGTTSAETQDGSHIYDRAIVQSDVPSWMFYLWLDLLQLSLAVPSSGFPYQIFCSRTTAAPSLQSSPLIHTTDILAHVSSPLSLPLSLSLCTQPFQHWVAVHETMCWTCF